MNTKHLLHAIFFGLLVVLPQLASSDDTDIYLAAPPSNVNPNEAPNVLVVFDTSGSMQNNSLSALPTYNPATNYLALAGADPLLNAGRIYWTSDGTMPPTNTDQWFLKSNNNCRDTWADATDASARDVNNGYYTTNIAYFHTTNFNWRDFPTGAAPVTDVQSAIVDCVRDEDATDYPLNTTEFANPNSTSAADMYGDGTDILDWPNLTVVTLWSANYLAYINNASLKINRTRLAVAKDAVIGVIEANPSLRFGVMAFNTNGNADTNDNNNHGGRIVDRVDTMNKARRAAMAVTINNLVGSGSTPLSEALYEARRYFGQLDVYYGDNAAGTTLPIMDVSAVTGTVGNYTYKTPITDNCQTNFIIFMTDGAPTRDEAAQTEIQAEAGSCDAEGGLGGTRPGINCMDDLADWMAHNDVLNGTSVPDTIEDGDQKVLTYTIGFGSGLGAAADALLQDTADRAGTEYIPANSEAGLTTAFQRILSDIQVKSATFVAPAISINSFNTLFHRDEIYLALFKPSATVYWDGNIKKYSLCTLAQDTAGTCDFGEIIDANNAAAIDSATGKISATARELWSTTTDGDVIKKGGAGDQIGTSASRRVYTYTGAYDATDQRLPAAGAQTDLANSANAVTDGNAALTAALLGAADATARTTVINWMRGIDAYDENTNSNVTEDRAWRFSDPLHSRPVVVSYGAENDLLGDPDPDKPIDKILVGGNDGGLRMINAKDGKEEWTFVPQELLSVQAALGKNSFGNHIYGLDNTVTVWTLDNNGDGIIVPGGTAPTGADKVYAFVTMRRGGNNIYGLDITPSSTLTSATTLGSVPPRLLWVIRGGVTPGYERLGQTWSLPQIKTIRFGTGSGTNSVAKTVLMFGGGYDTNQDVSAFPSAGGDATGNAIYIADPITGQRIWWASNTISTDTDRAQLEIPAMDFSIPSDLALFDSNGDGAVNRIYFGDVAGQVFRIDLSPSLRVDDNGEVIDLGVVTVAGSSGYVFADIACTNGTRPACSGTSDTDRRKFFYSPNVAQVSDPNNGPNAIYDVVTMASGNRSDPLDLRAGNAPIHNGIYVFRDYNTATGAPATVPAPITFTAPNGGLVDLTTEATDLAALQTSLEGSPGWYINLIDNTTWVGEKGLARTTIFGGTLFVTTFMPPTAANLALSCSVSEGSGRLYALNLLNGQSTTDFDGDNDKDRILTLGPGIPPETAIIIRDDGTSQLGGPQNVGGVNQEVPRYKTYWYH